MSDWKRALQRAIEGVDNLSDEVRLRLSRLARAGDPLKIYSYLGFGTPHRLLLSGRVLQDERNRPPGKSDTRWRNLVELYRFLESDEVPGARVRARFLGAGHEAVADREGYFGLEIKPAEPLASHGWHDVPLELLHPAPPLGGPVHATARVLVPPPTAQFGVISDIDDTVLWSNVTHKLEMLLIVALSNAHTRKPFKGVAAFYQDRESRPRADRCAGPARCGDRKNGRAARRGRQQRVRRRACGGGRADFRFRPCQRPLGQEARRAGSGAAKPGTELTGVAIECDASDDPLPRTARAR